MKTAKFTLEFDSEEEAYVIAEALKPEIIQKIPKTKVETKLSKNTFFIEISTDDISSLRAASNSYLRWINTALSVKKSI